MGTIYLEKKFFSFKDLDKSLKLYVNFQEY